MYAGGKHECFNIDIRTYILYVGDCMFLSTRLNLRFGTFSPPAADDIIIYIWGDPCTVYVYFRQDREISK